MVNGPNNKLENCVEFQMVISAHCEDEQKFDLKRVTLINKSVFNVKHR